MNLIGAMLVNLWVAGWAIAAVRAGLKARAADHAADRTEFRIGSSSN